MNSRVRAWIGWALGLALLALLAWRLQWRDAIPLLRHSRPGWLVAAACVASLSITLRALRLHALLPDRAVFRVTWQASVHAYFGALLLPLGGGELLKAGLLTKRHAIPAPQALVAVGMDRLFDVTSLLFLLTAASGSVLWHLLGRRSLALVCLLALLLGLLVLTFFHLPEAPGDHWVLDSPRLPLFVRNALRQILELSRGWNGRTVWNKVLPLQLAILSSDVLSTTLALQAAHFAIRPPLWCGLTVTVFIQLAFALPLLPGSLGTHQAACLLALGSFQVPPSEALAFSFMSQATHVLMVLGLNGIALCLRPVPLGSPPPAA